MKKLIQPIALIMMTGAILLAIIASAKQKKGPYRTEWEKAAMTNSDSNDPCGSTLFIYNK